MEILILNLLYLPMRIQGCSFSKITLDILNIIYTNFYQYFIFKTLILEFIK